MGEAHVNVASVNESGSSPLISSETTTFAPGEGRVLRGARYLLWFCIREGGHINGAKLCYRTP